MMRYNLLVPIAGRGTRMAPGGHTLPKPMILAGDRTILDWSMSSIDYAQANVYFAILAEHAHNFALDRMLEATYPGCTVIQLPQETAGTLETCVEAVRRIRIDAFEPLVIYCPDTWFSPCYAPEAVDLTPGWLLTFKANSPAYSYVLRDENGVFETREKVVISNEAAVGVYGFLGAAMFQHYAEKAVEHGETYICPIYNAMIADGLQISAREVESIHIMGTAEEHEFFEHIVWPYIHGPSGFVLCADHSGFRTKEAFKNNIRLSLDVVVDCGTFSDRDCDRFDFLAQAAKVLAHKPGAYGVGFCRSGQGMAMEANHLGLRAVLVRNSDEVRLAIEHNAANFFAIPLVASLNELEAMMLAMRDSRFLGGRHQNRLMKAGF